MTEEKAGPFLTLDGEVPCIVKEDVVRHTTAPQLFNTGGGSYIGYADDWREQLDLLYPDGWHDAAQQAAETFGLAVTDEPTIWLLVAMTLED